MKLKNTAVTRDADGIDVSATLRFMPEDVFEMTDAVTDAVLDAFAVAVHDAGAFASVELTSGDKEPTCPTSNRQAPQSNDAPIRRPRASSTATSAEPTNQNDAASPPAAGVSGTIRRARNVKSAEATTAAPTAQAKPSENELGASRRGRRVADPQSDRAGGAAGATPPAEKTATEPAAPRRGRPPRQATASAATAPSTAPATATKASATMTSPSSKLPSTVDVSKALTVAGGKIGPKMVKEYAEEWGISSAHDVPEMSRRGFIDGLEQLVKANGG